jgi:hypothetical protein
MSGSGGQRGKRERPREEIRFHAHVSLLAIWGQGCGTCFIPGSRYGTPPSILNLTIPVNISANKINSLEPF